jgi:hypothetical protein
VTARRDHGVDEFCGAKLPTSVPATVTCSAEYDIATVKR